MANEKRNAAITAKIERYTQEHTATQELAKEAIERATMTNDKDSAVLLPCPFCGGEAEAEQKGTSRQSHIISCTDCHCSLETNETFGAGAAWNTRQPQTDALKIAREALEFYAAGIGHTEIEDGGKRAAEALAALKESK